MRIILIGNYKSDRQESMIRFAQMLHSGFLKAGFQAEIWWPKKFFGYGSKVTNRGLGKWLGYLDKWFVFPLLLRWRLRAKTMSEPTTRFHVCDHSNAPYLKYLPADRTVITCHDVLAIRGALGHTDAYAPASRTGKVLQKWISHYLRQAHCLASVSQFTLSQIQNLWPDDATRQRDWRVIHNAFNADFRIMNGKERQLLLENSELRPEVPFILHVGSGHVRKNRKLLIDMVAALGNKWSGVICFAGERIDKDLIDYARSMQLAERIVSLVNPTHDELTALYNSCAAFIFPSFSEGFGWPLIEAQACGAPVIASNLEPMPEVSGGAALYADPHQPQEFAKAFLLLSDEAIRTDIVRRGSENASRFNAQTMIAKYLDLQRLQAS